LVDSLAELVEDPSTDHPEPVVNSTEVVSELDVP
jgi:hypothetical protein